MTAPTTATAERARIVALIHEQAETWEAAAKASGLPERKRSDWIVMAMGARTILHSIQGDDMTERHGLYSEIDRLKARIEKLEELRIMADAALEFIGCEGSEEAILARKALETLRARAGGSDSQEARNDG
ncbi:hypothetical protein [Citreimonas sp.]|uniref:hypothetical protein n=1 Tax=Citreimonas sp. TaxID=3036715 RepID=UPI0040590D82